jgi:hypothetical protein
MIIDCKVPNNNSNTGLILNTKLREKHNAVPVVTFTTYLVPSGRLKGMQLLLTACSAMFQHNAERLLRLIERVYQWLPLGTVVNNKVLVVHGGISDITDLDWVRNLDRHKVRFTHQLFEVNKCWR